MRKDDTRLRLLLRQVCRSASSHSTDAMFVIFSLCLFYFSSTVAVPFQLAPPRLIRSLPSLGTVTSTLTSLNAFQCYDPTFPPPSPSFSIHYSDCTNAANKMLLNTRKDIPSVFSRSEGADIQLPWRMRSGSCMMALDVLNEDDEDIMCVQDAHEIALVLCRMCVGGYYRYGGRTPVGPRGVVYISVYGTTPVTVEAVALATPQPSDVVAKQIGPQIESGDSRLLNSLSLSSARIHNLTLPMRSRGNVSAKLAHRYRHLDPVKTHDCFHDAGQVTKGR